MKVLVRLLMSWLALFVIVGLALIIYFESSIERFLKTFKIFGP